MLNACLQERPRLGNMAEDHARKLGEPAEAGRLAALFAAGRLDGPPAAQLTALQVTLNPAHRLALAAAALRAAPTTVVLYLPGQWSPGMPRKIHTCRRQGATDQSRHRAIGIGCVVCGVRCADLAQLQAMCEGAMGKLVACDWAGMSPLEVALCQNAFQTSDPSR